VSGCIRDTQACRSGYGAAVASLLLAVQAWATPPFGFVVNQILVSGVAEDGISQHMQICTSAIW